MKMRVNCKSVPEEILKDIKKEIVKTAKNDFTKGLLLVILARLKNGEKEKAEELITQYQKVRKIFGRRVIVTGIEKV